MRNVRCYKFRIVAICGLVVSTAMASVRSVEPANAEALYAGFTDPSSQYGPRTWWHWINERVSMDGITKDLEAMKTMGYKGAHMINLPSLAGTDKSKVVEARLIYTTSGSKLLLDGSAKEEWFEAPAEISGGTETAIAPPGMTHGVFYLRDKNGFLITSEPLPPIAGPGSNKSAGSTLIEHGYAFRPGLLSLIDLAISARENAKRAGLNTALLNKAIQSAKAVAKTPVEEKSYVLSMRALRKAIKSLDVPEAKLPVLNQFVTEKW